MSVEDAPDEGGGGGLQEEARRNFLLNYRYRIYIALNVGYWGSNTRYQYFQLDNSYFNRRLSDTQRWALHPAGGAYTPVVNRGEGGGFWDTMGDDAQMYCFEKVYVEDANPYRFWTYNEVMIVPPDATNTAALNATFSSSDADSTLGTWNKFRPGSDRKYTWEFGDGGNYAEPRCRDSCFRITFQEDGQTEVAIRCNRSRYSSWFRPSLVKPGATPSEDEVAFGDQGWAPAWSRSMDPEGYKKVFVPLGEGGDPGGGDGGGGSDGFSQGYEISYGINPHVTDDVGLPRDRILAIDYSHLVVAETDVEDWGVLQPTFARHFGKVNTLLRSGSVTLQDAGDIDPTVPSVADALWKP